MIQATHIYSLSALNYDDLIWTSTQFDATNAVSFRTSVDYRNNVCKKDEMHYVVPIFSF